ncbi:MAG: DEAD/DEAH box helicase [Myxococcota bacterium]
MKAVVEGMKVRYRPRPDWGVGHLVRLDPESSRAAISFPDRDEPVIVSMKDDALERHLFQPGDPVALEGAGERFIVVRWAERSPGSPFARYLLEAPGGARSEHEETELRAAPPSPDLMESLRAGRVGDARSFILRKEALRLDDERRSDALGALFASRVMPLPYQVGVVQRVLSSPRPRFILADEVGLGKTIEAGMVFSALRLAGLARRVLIVAPSHLTVQWLVELAHKFNRLFTLMDGDRYAREASLDPERSPWAAHELVVTSLELLSRDARHGEEIAAPDAHWDLVIIDEAHHLRARRAYQVAKALASSTWALLLLTATPMKLDPEEYHRLLSLIDPECAGPLGDLMERMARQEEISDSARRLMEGSSMAAARLAELFPGDPLLTQAAAESDGDASPLRNDLLTHVAETYSLSDHLIRNRRTSVGGFTPRRLRRHTFSLPHEEREAREAVIRTLREEGGASGAVLARLLRQLDSSTVALERALEGRNEMAPILQGLRLPERDAKAERFLRVLAEIRREEPEAKVLVFTEARATLDWLVLLLGREGIAALGYHGDLGLVERDRHVARFRDPEGPSVLVSTEVGGEGRNFQFCHHLVNYDLPWSPAAVEQRIGRLDRIGQTDPVQIHLLEPKGSLAADVIRILDEAVGVFEETVGGLDAVLEEVEPRLLELALSLPRHEKNT